MHLWGIWIQIWFFDNNLILNLTKFQYSSTLNLQAFGWWITTNWSLYLHDLKIYIVRATQCNAVTSKFNWSCTICGMSSSRRFSVQRHIANIHKGLGVAVPFIEYLTGRKEGKYLSQRTPRFIAPQTPFLQKLLTEAENDYARKVAERVNLPSGPAYDGVASFIRQHKMYKLFKDTLSQFRWHYSLC